MKNVSQTFRIIAQSTAKINNSMSEISNTLDFRDHNLPVHAHTPLHTLLYTLGTSNLVAS